MVAHESAGTPPRRIAASHAANTPLNRAGEAQWDIRVPQIAADLAANQGNVDLLFIGDSITQLWQTDGLAVWNAYYSNRKAMNQGVANDVTQGVLYRLNVLEHLRGISPKLAVILIGVNNCPANDAELIADGIMACARTVRAKCPTTKVLVMSIFPTIYPAFTPGQFVMDRRNNVNSFLRQRPEIDNNWIRLLDIGNDFFNPGTTTINTSLLPDLLHPSALGYQVYASRIEPYVAAALA